MAFLKSWLVVPSKSILFHFLASLKKAVSRQFKKCLMQQQKGGSAEKKVIVAAESLQQLFFVCVGVVQVSIIPATILKVFWWRMHDDILCLVVCVGSTIQWILDSLLLHQKYHPTKIESEYIGSIWGNNSVIKGDNLFSFGWANFNVIVCSSLYRKILHWQNWKIGIPI